jgi:hypothetical protein
MLPLQSERAVLGGYTWEWEIGGVLKAREWWDVNFGVNALWSEM